MDNHLEANCFIYDLTDEGVSLNWLGESKGTAILRISPRTTLYLQSEIIVKEFVEKLVSDYNEMIRVKIKKGEE